MKIFLIAVALLARAETVRAQPPLVGLGDSIGEGVQSGDASEHTQPFSYLAFMARQMRIPFPLPLISTSPVGVVGSVLGRSRIHPLLNAANLAVSGVDVRSLLEDRSDFVRDSETDLVLAPRIGSQMDVVERMRPRAIVCFVGSNDVLGAAVSFDQLDASQLTSVAEFGTAFREITTRLHALQKPVVMGTIPNVTRIAFLMNNAELTRFTGTDYQLTSGSYTSFVAGVLLRLRLAGPELLQDPDWVLDGAEIATIQARTAELNAVIVAEATSRGFAVAPVNALFEYLAANPPILAGVPLTARYTGGLFSLDGIHPSNTAHAILANLFLATMNSRYGTDIPLIDTIGLQFIASRDPFVDRNGNGIVTGRPGAGLFETLAPFLGFSGDDETISRRGADTSPDVSGFLREFRRVTGLPPESSQKLEVTEALRYLLNARPRVRP